MAVYVDDGRYRFGRMIMCHMWADTQDELDIFARAIGLRLSWKHRDHYDIALSKRRDAIRHGAIEITQREALRFRRGPQT